MFFFLCVCVCVCVCVVFLFGFLFCFCFLTFCVLLADNSVSDFIAFLRIPWFWTPAASVERFLHVCLFLLLLLGFVLVII